MYNKQRTTLQLMLRRARELRKEMESQEVYQDHIKRGQLAKELNRLEPVVRLFNDYLKTEADRRQAATIQRSKEESEEMRHLAATEYERLGSILAKQEEQLTAILLGKASDDDRDVFIEVRAGAGGDEAAIFVGDLTRMYMRYAEKCSWQMEAVHLSFSEQGGYRSAVLACRGQNVYGALKFESGTHRVQRVPKTEAQGRVHTSTCTVAIIPEAAEEDEIVINKGDLRIDTYRASGAGGQHVNKTDSAVRITHIPTGLVAECQEERSQHRNKEKAMGLLSARLLLMQQEQARRQAEQLRRTLVGSAERAEKIRTYNFPQNRITDHRIKLTLYRLAEIMDGNLDVLLEPLSKEERLRLSAETN